MSSKYAHGTGVAFGGQGLVRDIMAGERHEEEGHTRYPRTKACVSAQLVLAEETGGTGARVVWDESLGKTGMAE